MTRQVRFIVSPSSTKMSPPPSMMVTGSVTCRLTTWLMTGVVLTWHSYSPLSYVCY